MPMKVGKRSAHLHTMHIYIVNIVYIVYILHMHYLPILLVLICSATTPTPELGLSISTTFLNNKISQSLGVNISLLLNTFPIPNITIDQKVSLLHLQANITNLTQYIWMNWSSNSLHPTSPYNFTLNIRDTNVTVVAFIEYSIDGTKEQDSTILIDVSILDMDVSLYITQPPKPQSSGFNVQVAQIYVNTTSIVIDITGKTLTNRAISLLQNIIKPKIPSIVNNIAQKQLNPFISQYLSHEKEDIFTLGNQTYILAGKTTTIPSFTGDRMTIPLSIQITNLQTLNTNHYSSESCVIADGLYADKSISLALSSHLINTLLWLVQDSFVLHQVITSVKNSPIPLITTNLSILLPGLRNWPNKPVILQISPASRVSAVYVVSGTIRLALSLSVKIIVNTSNIDIDFDSCIGEKKCIQYCDLNVTVFGSVAIEIINNLAKGVVHSLTIAQVETLQQIDSINVGGLKNILNSIVKSTVPQINQGLAIGMPVNATILKVKQISMKIVGNQIGLGINL